MTGHHSLEAQGTLYRQIQGPGFYLNPYDQGTGFDPWLTGHSGRFCCQFSVIQGRGMTPMSGSLLSSCAFFSINLLENPWLGVVKHPFKKRVLNRSDPTFKIPEEERRMLLQGT